MSWFIFAKIALTIVLADFTGGYVIKAANRRVESGYYGEAMVGAAALIAIIMSIWI